MRRAGSPRSLAVAAALAWLAHSGAAPAAGEPPVVAAEIRIGLGESAAIGDGALEIRFVEVASDSRCPKGETCIWEGDAIVRLALTSGGEAGLLDLHTTARASREGEFAGWRIELIGLGPPPIAGNPAPAAYVATLRVARGAAREGALQ